MSDSDKKKLEAELTSALGKTRNPVGAKNILALLFPKAESVLQTYLPDESDVNSKKLKRRLSQSDFSEGYFSLAPEFDSWGRSEFEAAVKGPPSQAFGRLTEKVERAPQQKRSEIRRIFLELPELSQEWLDAIIAASPDLLSKTDEDSKSLFSVDNEDRIRWIIVHGLRQLPSELQITLLKSAIETAVDLTVLTDIVRGLIGDLDPDGSKVSRDRFNFGDQETVIRELLLGRIRAAASTDNVWDQARPAHLLWFWWGANELDEVKAFVEKTMTSPVGIRKLLEITINRVRSTAGDYDRVPVSWEKFIDLKALRKRAVELIEAANSDGDVGLARRFLAALEKGRNDTF